MGVVVVVVGGVTSGFVELFHLLQWGNRLQLVACAPLCGRSLLSQGSHRG